MRNENIFASIVLFTLSWYQSMHRTHIPYLLCLCPSSSNSPTVDHSNHDTPSSQTSKSHLPSFSSLFSVKLNHENYLLWKAQLIPYLRGQNLFSYIDGSNVAPQPFDEITKKSNPSFLS